DPTSFQMSLSPSLYEAELTITQTYRLRPTEQMITLQHTSVFRQGRNRWLYAPPRPSFWGEERQISGAYLTTFYPTRDETEALALHEFVDRYVAIYCEQTNGRCSDSLNLTLRLETDPSTLPDIFNIYLATFWTTTRYQSIELPTLSLVGLPTDEASREALFGHYAAYVLAGINRRLVIDGRLGQEPFDRVLFNQQLAALGLPTYLPQEPVTILNTADVPMFETLGEYESLWSVASLPLEESYSLRAAQLVTFLQSVAPETDPLAIQRRLAAGSFTRWLEEVTGQTRPELERMWLRYMLEQDPAQTPLDTSQLPDQLIKLLCTVGDRTALVTYSPHKDRWQPAQTLAPTSRFDHIFHALPDDQGYMLETRPHTDSDLWSMMLVRSAVDQIIFQPDTHPQPLSYAGLAHPNGRDLLLQTNNEAFGFTEFRLLDLENCDKDSCELSPLDGLPVWSPTGEQVILVGFDGLHLSTAVDSEQQRIGRGYAPFWVDENTYGFLRTTRPGTQSGVLAAEVDMVLGELDTGKKVVRTAGQLLAQLPAPALPSFQIQLATASPAQGMVYLVGHTLETNAYHLLAYDPQTETTAVRYTFDHPPAQPSFSPNSRWLSLTTLPKSNQSDNSFITLHLIDLRRDRAYQWTISLPPEIDPSTWQPDWSADSRWLVLNGREYLHLVQPTIGREWRTIHDYESCHSAQWLTP
ncbi:MAG: hypothetical protein KDD89_00250, partial [Anaerolineales bacterium]|nr:hypothetical protein [Anaerolineales bacterium]